MIYYPSISAIQLAPTNTGSQSLYEYLCCIESIVSINKDVEPTEVQFDRKFFIDEVPCKALVCTIRNPYEMFFVRWQTYMLFAEKHPELKDKNVHFGTCTFEYYTYFHHFAGKWATPLSASSAADKGLWLYTVPNYPKAREYTWGQITDQIKACTKLNVNDIVFLRLESFVEDVNTFTEYIYTYTEGLLDKFWVKSTFDRVIATDTYKDNMLGKYKDYYWKDHYTQGIADIVYPHYRDDFEAFGYDKDSWKK